MVAEKGIPVRESNDTPQYPQNERLDPPPRGTDWEEPGAEEDQLNDVIYSGGLAVIGASASAVLPNHNRRQPKERPPPPQRRFGLGITSSLWMSINEMMLRMERRRGEKIEERDEGGWAVEEDT